MKFILTVAVLVALLGHCRLCLGRHAVQLRGSSASEPHGLHDLKVTYVGRQLHAAEAPSITQQGNSPYTILRHAVSGRRHMETGHVQYKDLVVLVGGFNQTHSEFLLSVGHREADSPLEVALQRHLQQTLCFGSSAMTLWNTTSRTWAAGPPLPHDASHNTLALSPDGVLHSVASPYFSCAAMGLPKEGSNYSQLHYTLNLTAHLAGEPGVGWVLQPQPAHAKGLAGGSSCVWMDEHMYCVAGSLHPDQVDTFSNALTRYSPATGQWEALAPCPEQHDHSETFVHGGKLWVVGGKGHWPELPPAAERPFIDMHYYRSSFCLHRYDPTTNTWSSAFSRMPTQGFMTHAQLVPRGTGGKPTLLVMGGEVTNVHDGVAMDQVMEYCFETDLWYCHRPLPQPAFGGGHGYNPTTREVHLVSGSTKHMIATVDDVLVISLDALPDPEPCMVVQHTWRWWAGGHTGHSNLRRHPFFFSKDIKGKRHRHDL